MRRLWHNYLNWEDYKCGMWRKAPKEDEDELLSIAVRFMRAKSFGVAMKEVIENWHVSCEQNLSNIGSNRRAWLGQAACCYKKQIPEYITRQAWAMLTDEKRIKGNEYADKYIAIWEKKNRVIQLTLW